MPTYKLPNGVLVNAPEGKSRDEILARAVEVGALSSDEAFPRPDIRGRAAEAMAAGAPDAPGIAFNAIRGIEAIPGRFAQFGAEIGATLGIPGAGEFAAEQASRRSARDEALAGLRAEKPGEALVGDIIGDPLSLLPAGRYGEAAVGAVTGALSPAESLRERLTNTALGAAGGRLADMTAPLMGRAAGRVQDVATGTRSPADLRGVEPGTEIFRGARVLEREGGEVLGSQALEGAPGQLSQLLETGTSRFLPTSLPGRAVRDRNQRAVNNAFMRAVGIRQPERFGSRVTQEAIQDAIARQTEGFDDVFSELIKNERLTGEQAGVSLDPQVFNRLAQTFTEQPFRSPVAAEEARRAARVLEGEGGRLPLGRFQEWFSGARRRATDLRSSGDSVGAGELDEMLETMEDSLFSEVSRLSDSEVAEQSINNYRRVREQYRVLKSAIGNSNVINAGGDVSPRSARSRFNQVFGQGMRAGMSTRNSETRDFFDVATLLADPRFSNAVPTSGTAEGVGVQNVLNSIVGGGGAAAAVAAPTTTAASTGALVGLSGVLQEAGRVAARAPLEGAAEALTPPYRGSLIEMLQALADDEDQ